MVFEILKVLIFLMVFNETKTLSPDVKNLPGINPHLPYLPPQALGTIEKMTPIFHI